MLDNQPERFPRPSDFAGLGTNLSVPPIVANAKKQQQSSPPSTLTRTSWSQGRTGDNTSSWSQGRIGEGGTNELSSPDRRSSTGGVPTSPAGATAPTEMSIATAVAAAVDYISSSASTHTRDDDLQRCYQVRNLSKKEK